MNSKRVVSLTLSVGFNLLSLSSLSAQITPLSAIVRVEALANVASAGGSSTEGDVRDTQENQWGTLLSTLSASALADSNDGQGNRVRTQGSLQSTWDSASGGGVTFSNFGWTVDGFIASGRVDLSGNNWEYSFTPDVECTFTTDYSVVGKGSTFGLQGFNISLAGGPEENQATYLTNGFDPNASGASVFHLTAGSTYTAYLSNGGNVSGGVWTGSMDATFRWKIAAVPSPSAWVTLLFGAVPGGIVLLRRRRK